MTKLSMHDRDRIKKKFQKMCEESDRGVFKEDDESRGRGGRCRQTPSLWPSLLRGLPPIPELFLTIEHLSSLSLNCLLLLLLLLSLTKTHPLPLPLLLISSIPIQSTIAMGSETFLEIILAILLPPVGVFLRYGCGVIQSLHSFSFFLFYGSSVFIHSYYAFVCGFAD